MKIGFTQQQSVTAVRKKKAQKVASIYGPTAGTIGLAQDAESQIRPGFLSLFETLLYTEPDLFVRR